MGEPRADYCTLAAIVEDEAPSCDTVDGLQALTGKILHEYNGGPYSGNRESNQHRQLAEDLWAFMHTPWSN